jgi:pyruvate/2-oxoglutarate dehydrogenase complex dihydrolipoamide dehydrogenase (E3) component
MTGQAKGEGVYNVVVLGAGTAGLVTAAGTAGLGGRVALVERHLMGGDCLNTGCVPSKALIASARLAAQVRQGARWGLESQEPRFRFEDVMESVRARRATLAPHDSQERFEGLGVDVFRGSARFVSPREVEVEGRRLRGRAIVIATGSRAGLPPVEGLAEARPYTNETIFDELRERPGRMAVLGGGPIGCELGQAFARLGVAVTLLEVLPRLLDKEDAEAGEAVRARLVAEGVDVRTGARVRRVRREGARVRLDLEAATGGTAPLEVDALLVAAGRFPNVEGLHLETAGVAYDRKGVNVDAHLQTSQAHIFAAGDVTGGPQFTHVADHHARTVVRNILFPWRKAKVDTSALPWCTFTSPEVARVGLSEEEARKKGVPHDVWLQPMREVDRAVLESEEEGFAKVLTVKGGDRILGVTLVGERAGEVIHEFALAMKTGTGLKQLSATIHAYPTFAEVARKSGDRYQRSRLTPRARRLFAWLYRRALAGAS